MRRLAPGSHTVLAGAGVIGQSDRGTITGTVADPANAMVPGAKIVRNTETGTQQETATTDRERGAERVIGRDNFKARPRNFGGGGGTSNPLATQARNPQGVPASGFGRIDATAVAGPSRNGQLVARFQF